MFYLQTPIWGHGSTNRILTATMVSRRKILSRSRDDLNLDQPYNAQEEEEDVWYQKDKLYKVSFKLKKIK